MGTSWTSTKFEVGGSTSASSFSRWGLWRPLCSGPGEGKLTGLPGFIDNFILPCLLKVRPKMGDAEMAVEGLCKSEAVLTRDMSHLSASVGVRPGRLLVSFTMALACSGVRAVEFCRA